MNINTHLQVCQQKKIWATYYFSLKTIWAFFIVAVLLPGMRWETAGGGYHKNILFWKKPHLLNNEQHEDTIPTALNPRPNSWGQENTLGPHNGQKGIAMLATIEPKCAATYANRYYRRPSTTMIIETEQQRRKECCFMDGHSLKQTKQIFAISICLLCAIFWSQLLAEFIRWT